jgi:hypothetical protein
VTTGPMSRARASRMETRSAATGWRTSVAEPRLAPRVA